MFGSLMCAEAYCAARALGDDVARDSGRFADVAAAGAAHQVHVDMIVVIDVGARRQHGGEFVASGELHVVQKGLLFRRAVPAILHADLAAVGEHEAGDIERVAESVLGDVRVRIAVHAAAGIGRDLFDLDYGLVEPVQRCRLHGAGDPLIERRDDGAGQCGCRFDFDRAGRRRDHR